MNINQPFNLEDQSFEITNELKIRKILEENTNYKFLFERNPDDYGEDLQVFRYEVYKNKWEKNLIGYVEVECAKEWIADLFPEKWYCVSFLKRKIYKWDKIKGFSEKIKKEHSDITIYLKFNVPLNNCFCQTINYLTENGKESNRSDGSYYQSFLELDSNSDDVIQNKGIKKCCEFIENYFTDNKNLQQTPKSKIVSKFSCPNCRREIIEYENVPISCKNCGWSPP